MKTVHAVILWHVRAFDALTLAFEVAAALYQTDAVYRVTVWTLTICALAAFVFFFIWRR